ncbi:transporter, major facilitator family protein, partial [Teladorsagia circumcincta]
AQIKSVYDKPEERVFSSSRAAPHVLLVGDGYSGLAGVVVVEVHVAADVEVHVAADAEVDVANGKLLGIQESHRGKSETDAIIYSIARFLLGFGITISCGIAPMFITECSPKECRGVTSMMNGILLQIALVVGATLAMPQLLGTGDDWWKLYATEMAITATVMALMPFIHDSPGYLHSRADDDRSEQALRFYHNIDGEALRATLKQLDQSTTEIQGIGLVSVWKDRAARRGTLVGAVVGISMVMSGIAAINAFSFEILLSTGLSVEQASIGNIAICMMSVTGILFSSLIIDRFGRRTLLLSTYSLLAVINLIIAGLMFGFQRGQSTSFGYPLLAAVCLFNLVFAAGPGPMALFITGELVDQNARGAACTWATVFMCTVFNSQIPFDDGSLFRYVPLSCCTSFCQKLKEGHQRKFRIVGEIYRHLAKEDGEDLLHFQYSGYCLLFQESDKQLSFWLKKHQIAADFYEIDRRLLKPDCPMERLFIIRYAALVTASQSVPNKLVEDVRLTKPNYRFLVISYTLLVSICWFENESDKYQNGV